MNRNEERGYLESFKVIPMRCSSKLPARYPDTGLHIGGGPKRGKEGDETVTTPGTYCPFSFAEPRIYKF